MFSNNKVDSSAHIENRRFYSNVICQSGVWVYSHQSHLVEICWILFKKCISWISFNQIRSISKAPIFVWPEKILVLAKIAESGHLVKICWIFFKKSILCISCSQISSMLPHFFEASSQTVHIPCLCFHILGACLPEYFPL